MLYLLLMFAHSRFVFRRFHHLELLLLIPSKFLLLFFFSPFLYALHYFLLCFHLTHLLVRFLGHQLKNLLNLEGAVKFGSLHYLKKLKAFLQQKWMSLEKKCPLHKLSSSLFEPLLILSPQMFVYHKYYLLSVSLPLLLACPLSSALLLLESLGE